MVAVISLIFSVIESLFAIVLDVVFSVFSISKGASPEYSAKFVSPGSVMSVFNYGYSLTGGLRATTRDVAYKNALIVGPSGSGKTSTVLMGSVYTLARGKASMCIMDVSGELYQLTSGYLASKGYAIYCIDFGINSDGFNPIGLCSSISDILKVAFLLIKNSGVETKNDPYWSSSGEMMLAIFMEYLLFHAAPEYRSMANLVWLTDTFAAEPAKVDRLFVAAGNPELLTKYKAMNAVGDKTLQSTLSTVRAAIKVFGTPSVRRCTAKNTIDLASFRQTKSVLYICTPINDVAYYAPLSALLFEALFKEMMAKIPGKEELSVFCLLDEMVQMRFSNLGLVYSNCRKYKMGCMGIVQDERMLEMSFSPAESHSIRSNSSKVYLPGQQLATCKILEETLGRYIVTDQKTGAEKQKLLMSAAQIRMCKEAILLVGAEAPVKASLKPFYSHWKLRKLAQMPPYVSTRAALAEPPLIPFA